MGGFTFLQPSQGSTSLPCALTLSKDRQAFAIMTGMSKFLLLLSLLPLIGVNIWHGILLAQGSKDNRPHSISHQLLIRRNYCVLTGSCTP